MGGKSSRSSTLSKGASFGKVSFCFVDLGGTQVEFGCVCLWVLLLSVNCKGFGFWCLFCVVLWNSVVEQCLGRFVDERKARMLKEKGLPLEGAATVAGRTDKGVTALNQVCSFCMLNLIACLTYIVQI